ncbi:MAG: hypothetical protein OXH47_09035 [Paracoccaceae bacterium]|nr:hypothetical protein [Paracoccaceae bacterium]
MPASGKRLSDALSKTTRHATHAHVAGVQVIYPPPKILFGIGVRPDPGSLQSPCSRSPVILGFLETEE